MVQVLDKGFVELEDFMGGDLTVVNSAKVSFKKRSVTVGEAENKLINYLMKHRHGSPFEHTYFTFYIKAPLFVVREWQRHRIGSFNEMSGRYVKFEPEFYVPETARVPAASNKQGSVVPYDSPEGESLGLDDWNLFVTDTIKNFSGHAYRTYERLIDDGVANEMARLVLPLNMYTEFFWTVNARSLMNFLNLRLGEDAQWEIRQFAEAVADKFAERMPATYVAWSQNNNQAP
jgi:thymidylate synthase (FAD)